MTKVIKFQKAIIKLSALAFFAGVFFCCCAFTTRLPHGVIVNGTNVGGLTFSCAEKVLRQELENKIKGKTLRICADERVFYYSFPEVYYLDDFSGGLKSITKKGEYNLPVFYYLNGAESIADYICDSCEVAVTEPYASFNLSGEPFEYYEGNDGVWADRQKLLDDISSSLNGNWESVRVSLTPLLRKGSLSEVKNRTIKLQSFTTYFDCSNTERTSNIRLAASKINGTIVPAGECFSFNETVGARTEENGYKTAKIIEDGKFVLGVGGGVCQVSTTLYNAAILSGMSIAEYHPHSLSVGYVPLSRDAMVSGSYCDLKFVNSSQTPVYVRVKCTQSSICCTFYGESDGYNYSFRTEVTGTLPRPEDVEVEGDEDKILSYGKDGATSLGYLIKERDGECEETLVRKDRYAPVAQVRQVKKEEEEG